MTPTDAHLREDRIVSDRQIDSARQAVAEVLMATVGVLSTDLQWKLESALAELATIRSSNPTVVVDTRTGEPV